MAPAAQRPPAEACTWRLRRAETAPGRGLHVAPVVRSPLPPARIATADRDRAAPARAMPPPRPPRARRAAGSGSRAFVIAALGNPKRLRLAQLELTSFPQDWDCFALMYAPVNMSEFIQRSCTTMLFPHTRWGSIVHHIFSHTRSYSYVALLLDDLDVRAGPSTLGNSTTHGPALAGNRFIDPNELVQTMVEYNGSIISPMIRRAHHMGHMNAHPCLYETRFIEFFYLIFDRPAWHCLGKMFDVFPHNMTTVSGWGFDFCLWAACVHGRKRMLYDSRVAVTHGRRLTETGGVDSPETKRAADDFTDFVDKPNLRRDVFALATSVKRWHNISCIPPHHGSIGRGTCIVPR